MQMLVRHFFVMMIVAVDVLAVNMDMRVCMRVLMGVRDFSVCMLVRVRMFVLVGVLQFDGVFDHEIGADDHYNQSNIELDRRSFS